MAALIRGLMGLWAYLMRAAPMLLAGLLAMVSYFTALKAGIRLWDNSPPGSLDTPDYFVETLSWTRVQQQGNGRLELISRRMEHIPKNDLLYLDGLRLQKQSGQSPMLLAHAKQATVNQMNGEVWLLGDVDIRRTGDVNRPPVQLKSPRALLDTDRELLTAFDKAVLTRGDSTLTADQIQISQISGEIAAKRGVQVQLAPR